MYPSMTDAIAITSFVEASEILRDRRFSASAGRPHGRAFLGESILLIDGEEHLARRRLYMPLMMQEHLQHIEENVMLPTIKACEQAHFRTDADGFHRGDLTAFARDVFMRLAAALIGLDGYASPEASSRLYELLGPISDAVTVEWTLKDREQVLRLGLEAKEAFREEFVQPSWNRRQHLIEEWRAGRISDHDLPLDLLILMLRGWMNSWDADLPVRESILFLAGSTGNPVGQVVYALQDLRRWESEHPGDGSWLLSDDFLRDAIDETLRLHIAGSPALVREATEDVVLKSTGRTLKAGSHVALQMEAANRDTSVFGVDAHLYDPLRRSRLAKSVKAFGVAFGGGAHVCLGRPMVLGRSTGVEAEGLQYMVLRRLLERGVVPDPDRPPAFAASGQRYYETFPVRCEGSEH